MSVVQELRSEGREMSFPVDYAKIPSKIPVKEIVCERQPTITNPIDPKRISKESASKLTLSSAAKAGLVFLSTIASYYLLKTGVSSYFGLRKKNQNSKDIDGDKILKVKNKKGALTERRDLETASQVNGPSVNWVEQKYKAEDKTVKFEEIKVEKFKDFSNVKKANIGDRRSIVIKNPIPDQNVIANKPFELTIVGTEVFSAQSAIYLEATNIPTWLTSSNPNPTFKGSYDTPNQACEVALSENYAYVADYLSLQIIDVSDPSNPTFAGSLPCSASGVTVSGNYAYVIDYSGLQIIDITNPVNSTFKGSYEMSERPIKVAVSYDYAYVVNNSGLQIIDVSDPSNPTFKSSYDTTSWAKGAAFDGAFAYVTDDSGLQIIDITNPLFPTFAGLFDSIKFAGGVALSEWKTGLNYPFYRANYAYVSSWGDDSEGSLTIIDVRDPSNPTFKGSYDMPSVPSEVAISGNYAYVADQDSGLQIIDINDLENPKFQSAYATPDQALGVILAKNYAFVADGTSGLQIIALNSDSLTLSGIPRPARTDSVDITACTETEGCITDSFEINSSPTNVGFTTTLIIIGSIIVLL